MVLIWFHLVFHCCMFICMLYTRKSPAESFDFSRDQRRNTHLYIGLELNSQLLRLLALLPESSVRRQGTTLVGARNLVLGPDPSGPCWLLYTVARFALRPPLLLFSLSFPCRNFGYKPVCPAPGPLPLHLHHSGHPAQTTCPPIPTPLCPDTGALPSPKLIGATSTSYSTQWVSRPDDQPTFTPPAVP